MKKVAIYGSVLALAMIFGGAGAAVVSSTAPDSAPVQRLGNTALGRLILARLGRAMTLKAELNLSDGQRKAIRETLKAHKPEIAAAVKPVAEQKRVLRDAILADKPDEAAIRKAADDLGHKIGDAAVILSKVKSELATSANLTPEQINKIAEVRAANDASVDGFFNQIGQSQP